MIAERHPSGLTHLLEASNQYDCAANLRIVIPNSTERQHRTNS